MFWQYEVFLRIHYLKSCNYVYFIRSNCNFFCLYFEHRNLKKQVSIVERGEEGRKRFTAKILFGGDRVVNLPIDV